MTGGPYLSDHDLVAVLPAARRCWGWLPAVTRAGRIFVVGGATLISRADGSMDQVQQGGHPHAGLAADPAMSGKSRRYP